MQEAILLARQAVRIEPYQERLYAQLIRTLLKMGNQKGAIAVYEEMSELFFSNCGPSTARPPAPSTTMPCPWRTCGIS